MTPIPYLFFKGNAREAFAHYAEVFHSDPQIMSFKDMPEDDKAQMPSLPDDAVMHAAIAVGEGWIYGSDDLSTDAAAMAGCNVHVEFPGEAETRRVFDLLARDGEVRMPLMPMFWAPLFGTLTDRFGVRWMISQAAPPS